MKNKLKIAAFYMLAVMLGGCVPSLHPLFTDEEIVFDANLVGVWAEPNSPNSWEFKPAANKKYDVIYTDEKGKGKFDGRLGKIGKEMYLDLYPQDMNVPGNDFYKWHLLGVHTFMEIELSKKGLELAFMAPDSLKELLKKEPNAIKHEEVDDRIVLTASTKELQAFVLKYSNSDKVKLFGNENDKGNTLLQRVKQQDANSVK